MRRLIGIITIVQEDRLRLVDRAGRGYLLTLGRRLHYRQTDLWELARRQQLVVVDYSGEPELGGVIHRLGLVAHDAS